MSLRVIVVLEPYLSVSLSVRFLKMLFFNRQRLLNINLPAPPSRLPYSFFLCHTSLKALGLSLQEVFAQENLPKDVSIMVIDRTRIGPAARSASESVLCPRSLRDRSWDPTEDRIAIPLGGPLLLLTRVSRVDVPYL